MVIDKSCGKARPCGEVAFFDGMEEGGRERAESGAVIEPCEVLLGGFASNGTACEMGICWR